MSADKNPAGINRRKFLAAGWGAALVALVGQAGLAMSNYLKPSKQAGKTAIFVFK